jgi:hypothetical protein
VDTQRISGVLLIASFAAIMLSTLVNAPGLYQTDDISERLRIVETHRTRWLANQALVTIGVLLTAVGFALLASVIRKEGGGLVPLLGAVAIAAGTLAGLYFVYLQTTDPRGGYSGAYLTAENLAYWLWLAGYLLFGIAFLQTGLPNWLGYLSAGAAAIYGVVFLITGAGFITPFIMALLSLVIGIVILRQ